MQKSENILKRPNLRTTFFQKSAFLTFMLSAWLIRREEGRRNEIMSEFKSVFLTHINSFFIDYGYFLSTNLVEKM